jgi:uncharacterized protein YuzE
MKRRVKKVKAKKTVYCKDSSSLYIYLGDKPEKGEAIKTEENNYLVLADKDKNGKLIGIEIVGIKI